MFWFYENGLQFIWENAEDLIQALLLCLNVLSIYFGEETIFFQLHFTESLNHLSVEVLIIANIDTNFFFNFQQDPHPFSYIHKIGWGWGSVALR